MGKTGRWIRNLFTPRKDRDTTPLPKEKRRWSFRRSSAAKSDATSVVDCPVILDNDAKKHAAASVEEMAAVKIQSFFRAHLARKALNALKGLVKLQALVRGHLVRKQATATLRCMQALVSVQARARAQRLAISSDQTKYIHHNHRKSTNSTQELGAEENIKIVEMDIGDYKPARKSYSNLYGTNQGSPQCSSAMSKPESASYPRSEYAESLYSDYPFYPNYMSNTESSRAKVRSQSAPKQRPVETFERQSSKRRQSIEGRNVPRAVRMQRSSSHVGSSAQYPWSVKLDKSAASLKDSECGSTNTVLTNYTNNCSSLVGFEVRGSRY